MLIEGTMKRTRYNKFMVGYFKVFGIFFSTVSLILFFNFLGLAFDPEATIKINGVPTNELKPKLLAVALSIGFFIIGVVLALCPSTTLEKIIIPKFLRHKKDA